MNPCLPDTSWAIQALKPEFFSGFFFCNFFNCSLPARINSLQNKDIIIKPADKGGATVIQNTSDYITEAMRQLSNEEYYKKVEYYLTSEHEQLINQCINNMIDNGDLEEDIGQLLRSTDTRTPIFYMLPKIHKPNNPGRPVVSSVNSHTEKLSAYVDEFLRPLAERLPSHIRDTTDFIKRLRRLGKEPEKCILCTMDVSSPYTNIDTDEGLTIVEEELGKADQNQLSAKTLTCLLEKVLKLNNFTFNEENFIQIKGTAMGTRAAPNFANVYMGRFEEQFVYRTVWFDYIIDWVCFIDDIFLIWNGHNDSLAEFIEYLNGMVPSIKFTHEVSHYSVNFLDTKVIKDTRGNISTDVYQKPTETHPYLHSTSAHPPHLKYSIPYSQALRLRRICSSRDTQTKDSGIFQFFCRLWLPERESAGRNEESTIHNTRRESATETKGNNQSYTPCNDIQPTYQIYC